MLDLIIYFFSLWVLPVVVNKTTEYGYFHWIKPYLRLIWTAIFAVYSLYLLMKPAALEFTMKLHGQFPGLLGYVVSVSIGGILLGGYWWLAGKMLSNPPTSTTPNTALKPHIQPRLVIDAVDGDDLEFHVQIENMPGSPNIDKLRCRFSSPVFRTQEYPETSLPMGGHLSIPGLPINRLNKNSSSTLALNIRIEVKTHGVVEKFNFQYVFVVTKAGAIPRTIEPMSWNESARPSEPPRASELSGHLANNEGMFSMEVPERRPNGRANFIRIVSGGRTLIFDPEKRLITFSQVLNGVEKKVTQPFGSGVNARAPHIHRLLVAWKESDGGEIVITNDELGEVRKR